MENENGLRLFGGIEIRKIWHNEQWFFVLDDVLTILTDTKNPKAYWSNLRRKDDELKKGYGKIYSTLAMDTEGGKQKMNCANTEGVLRILMSVPSPKAEPLKLWLAQVGTERIQETENPEMGFERMKEIYKAKGYADEWIKNRLQSIATRKELTDEWKKRGVKEGQEYSILTATIAKGTFGLTPTEHAKIKGLEKQNLRDHMTTLELIFTALSEETTRSLTVEHDAQGFIDNENVAYKGGEMAGRTLKNYEKIRGQKVVSTANFLNLLNKKDELEEGDSTN